MHDGSEAPSHEASKVEPPTARVDGRGQVFGLTSTSVDYRRLLAVASQSCVDQCIRRRSFSITAAGQSQIHTGFPIKSGKRPDANATATMASERDVVNVRRRIEVQDASDAKRGVACTLCPAA
jgi:hypothetical protein